jgi:peptidoglycan/xylan/chitin deacetylase (PgdA/CDA1 family)
MSAAARVKLPNRAAAPMALLAAMALAGAPAPSVYAQKSADGAQMCWPSEALAFRKGEDRIVRAGRSGLIAPPRRTPMVAEPVPPAERLAIRRVKLPPHKRLVALTFDLCEQPYEVAGYQGGIVDYLRQQRIKATFFAGGKWMLTHEQRTQQLMSDSLFEIGNHTWEHRNLRLLKGSSLVKEIEGAQTAYEHVRAKLAARQCLARDALRLAHEASPRRLSLFRFPFGASNEQALEAVGQMGLKAVQWDVSSGDPWIGQKPEMIAKAVLTNVKPGSIVLFHANGRGWHTPSALPEIVEALKRQGYGFVTVSELLKLGKPEYSPFCYDSRKGDTDRYDTLAQRLDTLYERWRRKVLSGPIEPKSVPVPVPAKKPGATGNGFRTETKKEPW